MCLPRTARQNLRLHPQWIFLPWWGSFWSQISMRSTPNCYCLYIHYFSCILLTICKFTSTCVFIYICLSWRPQASRGTRTLSLWFTWGTQDSIDWVLYLWSKWRRAISGTGWQVWWKANILTFGWKQDHCGRRIGSPPGPSRSSTPELGARALMLAGDTGVAS